MRRGRWHERDRRGHGRRTAAARGDGASPSITRVRSGVFGRSGGEVHAVDEVSFAIAEGETLGLVGESGCGKSTLGKTVLRLIEPTAGTIAWRGQRIDELDGRAMRPYRRELQAVFQDPYASLNPRMRAADIVAEPIRNFEQARRARNRASAWCRSSTASACAPTRCPSTRTNSPAGSASASASRARSRRGRSSSSATSRSRRSTSRCRRR